MPVQFPVFEMFLNKRGRRWTWRVCTTAGDVVMCGSEGSRDAANYRACRALFLLLQTAPYRLMWMSGAGGAPLRSRPRLFRPKQLVQRRFPGPGSDRSLDHPPRV